MSPKESCIHSVAALQGVAASAQWCLTLCIILHWTAPWPRTAFKRALEYTQKELHICVAGGCLMFDLTRSITFVQAERAPNDDCIFNRAPNTFKNSCIHTRKKTRTKTAWFSLKDTGVFVDPQFGGLPPLRSDLKRSQKSSTHTRREPYLYSKISHYVTCSHAHEALCHITYCYILKSLWEPYLYSKISHYVTCSHAHDALCHITYCYIFKILCHVYPLQGTTSSAR